MQTTYTFRGMDTSDAIKGHAEEKLKKLDKFLIKPLQAHFIFHVEKFNHIVEITLTENGTRYVSHETSENMYTSIDNAVAKLGSQLKKYKDQLKDHKS